MRKNTTFMNRPSLLNKSVASKQHIDAIMRGEFSKDLQINGVKRQSVAYTSIAAGHNAAKSVTAATAIDSTPFPVFNTPHYNTLGR